LQSSRRSSKASVTATCHKSKVCLCALHEWNIRSCHNSMSQSRKLTCAESIGVRAHRHTCLVQLCTQVTQQVGTHQQGIICSLQQCRTVAMCPFELSAGYRLQCFSLITESCLNALAWCVSTLTLYSRLSITSYEHAAKIPVEQVQGPSPGTVSYSISAGGGGDVARTAVAKALLSWKI